VLLKGMVCTAQVELDAPLAAVIQQYVGFPDPVPLPPYGPHVVGVGVVPPIPAVEVVVDFASIRVPEFPPYGPRVVGVVVVPPIPAGEGVVDFASIRVPESLAVIDEVLALAGVVATRVEVEGGSVGLVLLNVAVAVWHVEDSMSRADL
jgi:hypothetical protein